MYSYTSLYCLMKVLISYVDIAGSTISRQKTLKEQYYFSCACSRCIKLVLSITSCFLEKFFNLRIYPPFSGFLK